MSHKIALIKILYVEDDDMIKPVVEMSLNDAGYELLMASDGTEAIAALEAHSGAIRGLVTDIDLGPGSNGWDVARRARELIQGLPVIYVSGASGHDWTSKGVPDSVMIAKPFAPSQIVVSLSCLLTHAEPAR